MEFERGEIVWTSPGEGDMTQERASRFGRGRAGHIPRSCLSCPAQGRGWGTLTEFVRAIQTGRQPESSGRDDPGSMPLMTAAVESAARRDSVAISRTEGALAV